MVMVGNYDIRPVTVRWPRPLNISKKGKIVRKAKYSIRSVDGKNIENDGSICLRFTVLLQRYYRYVTASPWGWKGLWPLRRSSGCFFRLHASNLRNESLILEVSFCILSVFFVCQKQTWSVTSFWHLKNCKNSDFLMTWYPQPVTLRMNNAFFNVRFTFDKMWNLRIIWINTNNRQRGFYKGWGDM